VETLHDERLEGVRQTLMAAAGVERCFLMKRGEHVSEQTLNGVHAPAVRFNRI
jgi:hypothetical protein